MKDDPSNWLWNNRGRLKCPRCKTGAVISGPYIIHGYYSLYRCLKCGEGQNKWSLAQHNGWKPKNET
jgi:hypothetical protein